VCDNLSQFFDLHLFNTPHASKSVIRLKFTAANVNSSRVRTQEETLALREHGKGIQLYQLQGNLVLSTAEVVVHDVMAVNGDLEALILDFRHVLSINESAARLFYQLLGKLQAQKKQVLFTNVGRAPQLLRYMKAKLKDQFTAMFRAFEDNDTALEYCENQLLAQMQPGHLNGTPVDPANYELFADLSADELSIVKPMLTRRTFKPGEIMVQLGDPAGEMFFLARGCASVTVPLSGGSQKRLATFSPGMAFGEMAMLDRAPRSAVVVADSEVDCDLLSLDQFDRLDQTHPRIKIVLLRNLALSLSRRLRKANREIGVFDE
jgi:glutaminase